MSNLPNLPTLHSEIERRIGRNVLLYQRIEHDLKELDRIARISGTITDLPRVIEEARKRSKGHTMGGAVSRFLEQAASKRSEEAVDLKGESIHLAVNWNISEDDLSRKAREERFKRVVDDRNQLTHGILDTFNPALRQDCEALMDWLDSAHDSALGLAHEVDEILTPVNLLFDALKVPEVKKLISNPQAEPPNEIRIPKRGRSSPLGSRVP